MSKKLKRYFNHQVAEIKSFFERVQANVTEEDIHRVRLAIKKIKALFILINAIAPRFKMHKWLVPFELLFDHAAKIREAQLQYNMLPQLPESPLMQSYQARVKHQIASGKKELKDYCDDSAWQLCKAKAKKAAKHIGRASNKQAKRFYKKHKQKLRKTFSAAPVKEEDLHDMRKSIKELQYYENMLHIASKNTFTDAFQEVIGRWHDKLVLSQSLQRYKPRKPLSGKERKLYQEALSILDTAIERDLRRIRKKQNRIGRKR